MSQPHNDAMDDFFAVYVVDDNGEMRNVVSFLPREFVARHGLIASGTVGFLGTPLNEGGELKPGNIARNPAFVEFLHRFIAEDAPASGELQEAAEKQGSGVLSIIDQRTPTPESDIPVHDIIGSFRIEDGVIRKDGYRRNPDHVILSDAGLFQLSPSLMFALRNAALRMVGE
jgi:hypothetical protein